MENPTTWTELETTIHKARIDWDRGYVKGKIGYSMAAHIAKALRDAGLVVDDERTRIVNDNPVQRSFDPPFA